MITDDLKNLFSQVFNCEPDEQKLGVLVDSNGEVKIVDILRYYLINGIYPPAKGKRFNPYGLLYKVSKNWKS